MAPWKKLKRPIIGLSPMDGITDAPFRQIIVECGKPDILFTEFTSVEGINAGATKNLTALFYSKQEKPIIAQLFGTDPECFYKAFFLVAELGFDGVDINMGCPAKNITAKGAGAGLINNPKLAVKIIKISKKASKDFSEGKRLKDIDLPDTIKQFAKLHKPKRITKSKIPISVKTRIGFNKNETKTWIPTLLETTPSAITIHGRTLKQGYGGTADWEAIAESANIAKNSKTLILGNGDIKSLTEAKSAAKKYNLDGVLIGRASLGNPWIFSPAPPPPLKEILQTAVKHAELFEKTFPDTPFIHMRKHLAWYCKGFTGASKIRQKLMRANSAKEVKKILWNI